jgi:hypothetical protein
MSGIHITRLAASKAHRHFVNEAKRAIRKTGWQAPDGPISPALVGAELLPVAAPPTLERAFGYRGDLRFLQFGYTAGRRQFGYSDGGDDLPSDEGLWSWFLHHPVITALAREPISHPLWKVRFRDRKASARPDPAKRARLARVPLLAAG